MRREEQGAGREKERAGLSAEGEDPAVAALVERLPSYAQLAARVQGKRRKNDGEKPMTFVDLDAVQGLLRGFQRSAAARDKALAIYINAQARKTGRGETHRPIDKDTLTCTRRRAQTHPLPHRHAPTHPHMDARMHSHARIGTHANDAHTRIPGVILWAPRQSGEDDPEMFLWEGLFLQGGRDAWRL